MRCWLALHQQHLRRFVQPESSRRRETIHCTEKCKDNGQLSPTKWNIGFCKDAAPSALCDFWAQDCEDGKACYLVSGGGTCIEGGGSTPEGGDCQFVKDCAKGLACGNNVCRKVCSIAAFPEGLCKPLPEEGDPTTCESAADCAGGETCTADSWAGPPPSCEARKENVARFGGAYY